MSPAVRSKYEATVGRLLADRDGNGVPDVFEARNVEGADVAHVTTTTTVYEINGRRYASLEEVPPEFRSLLDRLHPRASHDPFAPAPPPGLNIHLSWATVTWLLAGLALALCFAYLIWAR